jgi:hypothetical protein
MFDLVVFSLGRDGLCFSALEADGWSERLGSRGLAGDLTDSYCPASEPPLAGNELPGAPLRIDTMSFHQSYDLQQQQMPQAHALAHGWWGALPCALIGGHTPALAAHS